MQTFNITKSFWLKIPYLLILFGLFVNGQNLIKDPSFEQKSDCPTDYNSLNEDSKHWNSPTLGTTDYFSACSENFSPSSNFIGSQKPIHGKSFAGIYMYAPNDYREYVTTELKEKLEKGKTYKISFMVNLPEEVEYAVRNFSILFTKSKLRISTSKNINFRKVLKNRKSNFKKIATPRFIKDSTSWYEVSTTIVANGHEHYFTIGNFCSNENTEVLSVRKKPRKSSYYFIDMVSVEKQKLFDLNEFYVFENFQFDFDNENFVQQNNEQLTNLITYLNDHSDVLISLNGHTDASGTKEYNKRLSKKRAKLVAKFLIAQGIHKFRINSQGLGEEKPIADNSTEKGKLKNRRVEFIMSKKDFSSYASNNYEDE